MLGAGGTDAHTSEHSPADPAQLSVCVCLYLFAQAPTMEAVASHHGKPIHMAGRAPPAMPRARPVLQLRLKREYGRHPSLSYCAAPAALSRGSTVQALDTGTDWKDEWTEVLVAATGKELGPRPQPWR